MAGRVSTICQVPYARYWQGGSSSSSRWLSRSTRIFSSRLNGCHARSPALYSTTSRALQKHIGSGRPWLWHQTSLDQQIYRSSPLTVQVTHRSIATLPEEVSYDQLTIGIPKETYPGERRVAITPQNVALLRKKGFARILLERRAGEAASFSDFMYEHAGATIVEQSQVWSESQIVLKVRPPRHDGPNSEVDVL